MLPTIEGNVDYLALRGQLTTMDELLRTSGVENEFVTPQLEALGQDAKPEQGGTDRALGQRQMRCDPARRSHRWKAAGTIPRTFYPSIAMYDCSHVVVGKLP